MATHKGETFTSDVLVDGNVYVNCTFKSGKVIYEGGAVPVLDGCTFDGTTFVLSGPAQRTMEWLTALYALGGRTVVEQIFQSVRDTAKSARTAKREPV